MSNGEVRISAACPGGSAYIRTIGPAEPAWQDAHHHRHSGEFYVVVSGWMVVAERRGLDGHLLALYKPGETYQSPPRVDHNILLKEGACIDTLKYQISPIEPDEKENDWYEADPDFGRWTKSLSLAEVARQLGTSLRALA